MIFHPVGRIARTASFAPYMEPAGVAPGVLAQLAHRCEVPPRLRPTCNISTLRLREAARRPPRSPMEN